MPQLGYQGSSSGVLRVILHSLDLVLQPLETLLSVVLISIFCVFVVSILIDMTYLSFIDSAIWLKYYYVCEDLQNGLDYFRQEVILVHLANVICYLCYMAMPIIE